MTDNLVEARREKARNRRYKKAIAKDLNLETINAFLYETRNEVEEIGYTVENDDVFVDALGGDEDEAFEFRQAFSMLASDIEAFQDDLSEQWVPDCFDTFFAATSGSELLGYDEMEQDYFGFDGQFMASAAQREAEKRLIRLAKHELIDAAGQCLRIAVAYLGIRSRWEDLSASLDLLRGVNNGLLSSIKRIEELYALANKYGIGMWDNKTEHEFDALVATLPEECWLR